MSSMLRRIEKVLEQVRQTTRGRVPFHERPLQGYFFFFFSNSIRLTKKTETANINKLKRERISLSGRGECFNFSREIDIVCIIGHVFVCFVHTTIGLSRTSFIDMRYIKGKRSFVTVSLISIGNLVMLLI